MIKKQIHAKDTVEYLKYYQEGNSVENITIDDSLKEGTLAIIKQIYQFNPEDEKIKELLAWWLKKD